jgi:hypothetical protein
VRPQLPEGYYVKYRHNRVTTDGEFTAGNAPGAKGGETEARIYGPDDSLVALGIATCHERDNFCRRIGRDIALGRALKQLSRKAAVDD